MSLQARDLNFELYFVSEVLGLDALHYGFWDRGSASGRLDLEELRSAQVRFTDELVSAIPDGVSSVLDVGAGLGDSACEMERRGYDVTAISPDRNHEKYFQRMESPRLRFHLSTFEEFDTDARFDLLYFSESHNYFDQRVGLRQSRRLAKSGGHLLVSGMFRFREEKPFPEGFELTDLDYVRDAETFGFELVEARDITQNILPTVHIVHCALTDHLPPLFEMADMFLERRTPISGTVLRWLLGPSRRKVDKAIEEYRRKMDPDSYARHIRYATLLLRSNGSVDTPARAVTT